MGASGAGKTTLLNALSGRIKLNWRANLTGERTLNDVIPLDGSSFAKFGAYVMQDDILFEYFTVREAFEFAARLKLCLTAEGRKERVD
jgi:ATP-binding cassette subfamily G (WHITE) protein 2